MSPRGEPTVASRVFTVVAGVGIVSIALGIAIHASNWQFPHDKCVRGDTKACLAENSRDWRGRFVSKRTKDLRADLRIACNRGVLASCERVSHDRGCLAGISSSCSDAANQVAHRSPDPDPDRAVLYLQHGCDAGGVGSCRQLADLYLDGRGVSARPAHWLEIMQALCDHGGGEDVGGACFDLAWAYQKGWAEGYEMTVPDPAKAQAAFVRGCDLGSKTACYHLHPPAQL